MSNTNISLRHTPADAQFVPLNIAILTVSDTRDLSQDKSGQYIADSLNEADIICKTAKSVSMTYQIRAIVSHWIADPSVQVIISTGGTGFYGRDNTPEAVSALFDKTIDGFGEQFRAISVADIGMSTIQSGSSRDGKSYGYFLLTGSTGACRTAWEGILQEQLDNRTRPCNFVVHVTPKDD